LAAAKQAALLGVRGIALSTPTTESEPRFDLIKSWVQQAIELLLALPDLLLVNVNFPERPRGMTWTRQAFSRYDGKIVPGVDPMGRKNFWYTVIPIEAVEEGTDRWAMQQNLVSLTPLRLDLTNEKQLTDVQAIKPLE
jgi:5'-nucleotidase